MRILSYLSVCLMLTAVLGCSDSSTSAPSGKPTFVATTTMIADLARVLAGDDAEVVSIMKVGEDPHVYDVRPNDAVAISKADLVLANGYHLESTLDGVIEQAAGDRVPVIQLAEDSGIEPLGSKEYEGAPDPHFWMDVKYWKRYVEVARDAMVKVDPDNAAGYQERAAAYLAELDELDAWIREQFSTIPQDQRVIITSHDAFNYYAAAYGIEVHGVMGISTDGAVKSQDVENLRQLVKDRGIRALFIETSVNPALNTIVQNIADDTGASIGGSLYSDSLGAPDSAGGTYVNMMRHNTSIVVKALQPRP